MIFYDSLDESIKDVENYWNDQMPMLTMEECGELIQAISKLERYLNNKVLGAHVQIDQDTYDSLVHDVIVEMRDVHICMAALQVRYGIPDEVVIDAIEKKLDKKY